jgi:hypothetical protein
VLQRGDRVPRNKILEKLIDLGILVNANQRHFLARPPEKVSIGSLFQQFTSRDEIGSVYQVIGKRTGWEKPAGLFGLKR